MRTVLSTPRRPSFRLGLTPSAQTQFNAAAQQTTSIYNSLVSQLDHLVVATADDPQRQAWFVALDGMLHEADAIVAASAAADDASLPAMVNSLASIRGRMLTLSREWGNRAALDSVGSGERSAQKGWLIGAGAIAIGLAVGFAWISLSKRA